MSPGELVRRVKHFLQRDRMARELEEEMRLHVEMRAESLRRHALLVDDVSQARARNLSTTNDPAYAAARKKFGNTTAHQQRSRDMWGFLRADAVAHDVRFAVRRLVQQRAFSLSVIGVMAIGIGAVTAMFSAVDAALLRPLPFKSPEQLVAISGYGVPFDPGAGYPASAVRQPDITDLRAMPQIFNAVGAYSPGAYNLVDPERPLRIKVGVVTTNFFALLGIQPAQGRTFSDAEGAPDGPDVAVLSYGLWKRQYGGRNIAGMTIKLDKRTFDVVGVMPEGFSFPSESELWVPMSVPTTFATMDALRGFNAAVVVARLAPETTREFASAQLLAHLDHWYAALDSTGRSRYTEFIAQGHADGVAIPLQQKLTGDRKTAMLVLLGATALLLLIACVNVTNLLLSQASARKREIAVRQVLGASRARIVWQLLTESVVLSLTGAVAGVLLAPVPLKVMAALLPKSLLGVAPAHVDARVLVFAIGVAVVTGIAFGLWPALQFSNAGYSATIKSGGGHGATAGGARLRRALVSAELALTVMLLIGAGLMLRSFSVLMHRDRGLVTEHVGSLEITVPATAGNRAERLRNLDQMLSRIAAAPGIQSVGAVNDLPLNGMSGISIQVNVPGAAVRAPERLRFPRYLFATRGYFPTMGIRLLRGRSFEASDDSTATKVAIISQAMVQEYWPDIEPLGRTFSIGPEAYTVIGVVADVRERKLEDEAGPQMYLHLGAVGPSRYSLVARGTLPDNALLARMTEAVRSVDRSQAVYSVRMMDDVVSNSVAPRRANTLLIGLFALLALILAAVGVFAVVSHGVAQRSRELGIRAALGATGSSLVNLLASEMVLVASIGVAVGLGGAWALARTLESLVYGVEVHDTLTFVLVPMALVLPVVLATLVPARRALRVNPAEVMRAE